MVSHDAMISQRFPQKTGHRPSPNVTAHHGAQEVQWSDGTVSTLPETKLKTPHLWRSGEATQIHPGCCHWIADIGIMWPHQSMKRLVYNPI